MTIEELRRALKIIEMTLRDPEEAHVKADEILLKFIDDPVARKIYDDIIKWHA